MTKAITLTFCVILVGVVAEPPTNYLPPQNRNVPTGSYRTPGSDFPTGDKAPSFNSQQSTELLSYNSLDNNQFGASQFISDSTSSFKNSESISQQYGAPSQFGSNSGSKTQQYESTHSGSLSSDFTRNGNEIGFDVAQQYGTPSTEVSKAGFEVSQQYGSPSFGNFRGNVLGSTQLNQAAGFESANGLKNSGNGFAASKSNLEFGSVSRSSVPSSVYGVLSSKMEDDLSEPPNYQYTYEVSAGQESGAEFGHQESRENEVAKGVYHVLLPDGRIQIVEYEADEQGFRPVIRYEEANKYAGSNSIEGPY